MNMSSPGESTEPGRTLKESGDVDTNGVIEDDDQPQAGPLEDPKQPVPGSN